MSTSTELARARLGTLRQLVRRQLRPDWVDIVDPYQGADEPDGRLLTITNAPWGPYPKAADPATPDRSP